MGLGAGFTAEPLNLDRVLDSWLCSLLPDHGGMTAELRVGGDARTLASKTGFTLSVTLFSA